MSGSSLAARFHSRKFQSFGLLLFMWGGLLVVVWFFDWTPMIDFPDWDVLLTVTATIIKTFIYLLQTKISLEDRNTKHETNTPATRRPRRAVSLGHLGWVVGQVSLIAVIAMRFENSEACAQHSTKRPRKQYPRSKWLQEMSPTKKRGFQELTLRFLFEASDDALVR